MIRRGIPDVLKHLSYLLQIDGDYCNCLTTTKWVMNIGKMRAR